MRFKKRVYRPYIFNVNDELPRMGKTLAYSLFPCRNNPIMVEFRLDGIDFCCILDKLTYCELLSTHKSNFCVSNDGKEVFDLVLVMCEYLPCILDNLFETGFQYTKMNLI